MRSTPPPLQAPLYAQQPAARQVEQCSICFARPRSLAFVPCNHCAVCADVSTAGRRGVRMSVVDDVNAEISRVVEIPQCSPQSLGYADCPLCLQPIERVMQVFSP